MKMTIHRALAELKLLDKRIDKQIKGSVPFCVVKKKDEKQVNGMSLEEYNKKVEGNFNAIIDLIKRREQIKAKIMHSNTITKVNVAGEEMTVAEAIERKNTIEYKKKLLNRLRSDLQMALDEMEDGNIILLDKLESFLEATLGDNPSSKEIETVSEMFKEKNELKLYNPINIEKKIEKLEEEIEDFLMEVDFVLSESNSKTTIEID